VTSLDPLEEPSTSSLLPFVQPIQWCPSREGITFEELFASMGIVLVVALKVGLKVKHCLHVDNGFISNWVAYHHIQRLLALYLE